jgi:hypothetical protein
MDDFDLLFPTFKGSVEDLYQGLLVFAYLIMVLGLLLAAYRGAFGSIAEIVRTLVAIAVLSIVLGFVDEWVFFLGNTIQDGVIEELGTDPRETHTRFGEIIANPQDESEDESWYDFIFDAEAAVATALGRLLVYLAAKISWLIVWWAYAIQKGFLYFGVALLPLFLPMFLLNATRGIAIRYILGIIGILLWPLGWAVANIMTEGLLDNAADRTLFEFGGALGGASFGPQMIIFTVVASLWLVFSTIAAPVILGRVVTTGSQIGAALLGGFMGAAGAGLSGAVGGTMAAGGKGAGGVGGMVGGGAAGFMGGSMGGGASMAIGAGLAAMSAAGGGGGGGNQPPSDSGGGGGSPGGSSSPSSGGSNAKAAAIAAQQST